MQQAPTNPILKAFARVLSVVFHPGFLPFYFLIAISAGKSHRIPILIVAFLLLVGLPLLGTVLFLRKKGEADLFTVSRKNRYILFAFHAIGIGILWAGFEFGLQGYLPSWWIPAVFLFNAAGFLVTLFWKISLHMMGMSAMLGIMAALPASFPPSLWVIAPLSFALVAWARMYLRSHDWTQIVAGTALGFGYWFLAVQVWG